jgi:hypothetical protein
MKITKETLFGIGLSVSKGNWDGAQWTITGYPKRSLTVKEFESAYDFEEFVRNRIDCRGIDFDSEYCQFFAYAKTEKRALKFAQDIDQHFAKVRGML